MHPSLRNLTFIPVVLACAFSARAADLTSASFRMRAAHEASIAARAPTFSSATSNRTDSGSRSSGSP